MKPRTNPTWQFIDLLVFVGGSSVCVIALVVSSWRAMKGDWSTGVMLVPISALYWLTRVLPSLLNLREAIKADREFEDSHRGTLDWKGAPRDDEVQK